MKPIYCLNAISKYGTDLLTEDYQLTDDMEKAAGVLVPAQPCMIWNFRKAFWRLREQEPVLTTFLWINVQKKESWYLIRLELTPMR